MKVLLVISDYKSGFPYIQDLERELKASKVFVNVLDIENLFIVRNDGSTQKLADSRLLKTLLRLPKIRTYTRVAILKRFLRTMRGTFDAVGIHSCDLIYVHLVEDLRKVASNLSVTIWGSDFYRASEEARQAKKKILDACNLIVFGNPSNEEDLVRYYKNYEDRSVVCGFGVTKFDTIDDELRIHSREEIRSTLQLPSDRFVVTIGYNGTPGQQHEKLIESVKSLPDETRSKIFLLFQMSYGGSEVYKKQVEEKAKACGIPYLFITDFLSDQETSRIRIATDIVLNAQVTDGFSASIQEHIYAGNVVVVGEWLQYKSLDRAGIFYLKSAESNFGHKLAEVMGSYPKYLQLTEKNSDRIYQLSSWKSRLPDWISIYRGTIREKMPARSQ
jgi:hypothetical protein